MDIPSHAIISYGLAALAHATPSTVIATTIAGVIPDLPQTVLYFRVGFVNHRKFWIPEHDDWRTGGAFRKNNPGWSAFYDVPHSSIFWAGIIVPIAFLSHLSILVPCAYLLHIILDCFTHTNEWAIKPLYPFSWKLAGFTDVWLWSFHEWLATWVVLFVGILMAIHLGW